MVIGSFNPCISKEILNAHMRLGNNAAVSREVDEMGSEMDQIIQQARGVSEMSTERIWDGNAERYKSSCTSSAVLHKMKKDSAGNAYMQEVKCHASLNKKSKLRLFSRNLPSLLDADDSFSVRDDQNSFRSYLADESRTRSTFVPEDGDEVQPLPDSIKMRWNCSRAHDQQIHPKTTLETSTLVTEDSSQEDGSSKFPDIYASSTIASVSASAATPACHQESIEPDTRFERLYRLGTQELLMKRTLGYIKGLQESERSIIMDMKWRDYREKKKMNQTQESVNKTTSRLYDLSISKQNEGKKRRDQIATARAMRAAENHPRTTGYFPRDRDLSYHREEVKALCSRSVCSEYSDATERTNKSCNATFDRLYGLSKKRQNEGRNRRQHVAQNSGLRFPKKMAEVLENPTSPRVTRDNPSSLRKTRDNPSSPRKTRDNRSRGTSLDSFRSDRNYVRSSSHTIHDSLYNYSKKRQEEGKQLRYRIVKNSGQRFPEKCKG